jgi:hypothetical protein
MRLRRLFEIMSNAIIALILTSCDPTVHIENYVTWHIVNNSSETLKVRESWLCEDYIEYDLSPGEKILEGMEECDYSDTSLFEGPTQDKCSIGVIDEMGVCCFSDTVLFDKSNWELNIKPADSISGGDKPGFSEYNTWYDYTFTITDEMLEAARKGGGE